VATVQTDQICREICDNAPDAIVYADKDGIIRFWNHGASVVFGYQPEEVLGSSLDLIIPVSLRNRHWEGYHRVMATGESTYANRLLSTPALHKDGQRISVEFSVVMVHAPDGTIAGIGAIMRDVSERRGKEQALLARLAVLEAT
jgi:PAS domain S-box-containing protein